MSDSPIIVIGGGPAGCACALWLHLLGYPVLVLEKADRCGGLQLNNAYPNPWVPLILESNGDTIAHTLHQQLTAHQIPIRTHSTVTNISRENGAYAITLVSGERLIARFIVLATGSRPKTAGIQETPNITIGPSTKTQSKNVKTLSVAILGGGDNAFDHYGMFHKRGAKQVHIFARTIRAQKKLKAHVPASDITVGNYSVNTKEMTVNGRPFDLLCVLYGFEACIPSGLNELETTQTGYISANHWGRTNLEGVYAVGEATDVFHPCVTTAFAHGIQAAKSIQKQIEKTIES